MTSTQIQHAPEAWPTQVRLPGQTAATPGPVDMTMMYLMHHAFRRDLAAFAAAAKVTPVGDRESWRALAERWDLFSEVLHHHHTGEDTGLWPVLMERTDAAGREVLAAMEAEHAEIDPILEASAAGFHRLAAHADEDARQALAVRLAAAKASLADHLRHEETGAIPILQAVMTQADWDEREETSFKEGITFRQIVRMVPWVAHEVPDAVRRTVFAKPGGRANQVIWWLTRRGFERRDRVAFRHVA
jgi:hypothetical protein